MSDPFEIHGHQITLPNDRRVWAGKRDESWYISFSNAGVETKVRISFEAADALVKLLTSDCHQVWRYILKITDEKSEWVEVGQDGLAIPQAERHT